MSISAKDAKRLAVRYEAFAHANRTDEGNGIIVWGQLLLEIMEQTGIELADAEGIRRRIAGVKLREAAAANAKEIIAAHA